VKSAFASICLMMMLSCSLYARQKTDVVVFKNGDRLTCEIKGLSSGVLYANLDYVDGTVSLQWSKVVRIESTQRFIVTTAGGAVYTGTIKTLERPDDSPVSLAVVSENLSTTLERAKIVEVDQTSLSFFKRFSGAIGSGISFTAGNRSTQYNINSDLEYVRERWSVSGAYVSSLAASEGNDASTRNQIDLEASRLLRWKNVYYAGFGQILQSSSQGINRQFMIGGGIGKYIKRSNRLSWSILGGAGIQNTAYDAASVPVPNENTAAAIVSTELKVFKFKKTDLDVTATLLPALSEPGRLNFTTNASYYLKLFSDLKWNVTFYGNWDNKPPATFSGSDYGTSSGLSWTFGNR
jgi:hypothetical protein